MEQFNNLILDFCSLKIEHLSTRNSESSGVCTACGQHATWPTSAQRGEFRGSSVRVALRPADRAQERSHHVVQGLSVR